MLRPIFVVFVFFVITTSGSRDIHQVCELYLCFIA